MAIHLPWKNLGCLGISLGKRFYADVFLKPFFGFYVRISGFTIRGRISPFPKLLEIADYRGELVRTWRPERGWK